MSARSLLTQPLTVQAVGTSLDVYGNSRPAPTGTPVPELGYLEQSGSTEYVDGRQTTVTTWTAYLAADTVAKATSFLNFGGQVFQVAGEPWFVWNPRTRRVDHVEAKLIEVT